MLVMGTIQKKSLFICSLVSEVAHPYTQRIEKRDWTVFILKEESEEKKNPYKKHYKTL